MFSEFEGSRQEAYAACHGLHLVGLKVIMINPNNGGLYFGPHLN
jgi:hypothetical protein